MEIWIEISTTSEKWIVFVWECDLFMIFHDTNNNWMKKRKLSNLYLKQFSFFFVSAYFVRALDMIFFPSTIHIFSGISCWIFCEKISHRNLPEIQPKKECDDKQEKSLQLTIVIVLFWENNILPGRVFFLMHSRHSAFFWQCLAKKLWIPLASINFEIFMKSNEEFIRIQ